MSNDERVSLFKYTPCSNKKILVIKDRIFNCSKSRYYVHRRPCHSSCNNPQLYFLCATVYVRCYSLSFQAIILFRSHQLYLSIYYAHDADDPTTPPTTIPPTTTTPPAQADCNDLTGWWASADPKFEMNVMLDDDETTSGYMIGFYRDQYEQVWVEMAGRTRLSDFAYLGMTGILAADDGILGFTGLFLFCIRIWFPIFF